MLLTQLSLNRSIFSLLSLTLDQWKIRSLRMEAPSLRRLLRLLITQELTATPSESPSGVSRPSRLISRPAISSLSNLSRFHSGEERPFHPPSIPLSSRTERSSIPRRRSSPLGTLRTSLNLRLRLLLKEETRRIPELSERTDLS